MSALPEGARTIRPRRIGPGYNWDETMKIDAKLVRNGVTWFRVMGGFGGEGKREDWVMGVNGMGESVCDYNWNGEKFGPNLGSTREEAMDETIRQQLNGHLPSRIEKAADELATLIEAERVLKEANDEQ